MNSRVEPSADKRQAAHELREIYVALVAEGFTVHESLTIIGQILASGTAS